MHSIWYDLVLRDYILLINHTNCLPMHTVVGARYSVCMFSTGQEQQGTPRKKVLTPSGHGMGITLLWLDHLFAAMEFVYLP